MSRATARGYTLILTACVISGLMGACIEVAMSRSPQLTPASIGFVRVVANAVFVVALAPKANLRTFSLALRGQGDRWLWLWAGLGALTVATMFAAMPRIGVGPTSVLTSTSGAFTAGLAPLVLGDRWRISVLAATLLSLVGVLCMHPLNVTPGGPPTDTLGWLLGLISGLAAGLAYLAVARTRGRHSAATIMTYWSVVCLLAYLLWFAVEAPTFPQSLTTWALLIAAGGLASVAQFCTAKAYVAGPAATVAALSYAAPAFMLAVDAAAFGAKLSTRQWAGAAIILAAGVGLTATRSPGGTRAVPGSSGKGG